MRKRDFNLHLLAGRYASVERPGVVENPVNKRVVLVGDRPRKFASNEDMLEIRDEVEIRIPIEQIQGKV